jgi:hypothetical protein
LACLSVCTDRGSYGTLWWWLLGLGFGPALAPKKTVGLFSFEAPSTYPHLTLTVWSPLSFFRGVILFPRLFLIVDNSEVIWSPCLRPSLRFLSGIFCPSATIKNRIPANSVFFFFVCGIKVYLSEPYSIGYRGRKRKRVIAYFKLISWQSSGKTSETPRYLSQDN